MEPKLVIKLQQKNKCSNAPKIQLAQMRKWITATLNFVAENKVENKIVDKISTTIKSASKIEISISIVDQTTSAALNQQYRHKKAPTNVLSFPLIDSKINTSPQHAGISAPLLLGDLVICIPLVKKEALAQNKTFIAHCAHLIIHGTLHLMGYTHDKIKPAKIMENHEIGILKKLGYKNPYETHQ